MRSMIRVGALAVLAAGCLENEAEFTHDLGWGDGAVVGDTLRVVMTGTDVNAQLIETTTLAAGADPPAPRPVRVDGVPLDSGRAQLAAIGARAYLVWQVSGKPVTFRGAPLDEAGEVDGAAVVELGEELVSLRRVGDRFLVVHQPESGLILPSPRTLRGTWILPDGRVERTAELVRIGSDFTMPSDVAAGPMVLVYPYLYSNARELRVTRVDRDELVIARSTDDGYPDRAAVATLPDGSALVVYEVVRGRVPDQTREVHAARVSPAGELTDQLMPLAELPVLAARGDRVLALSQSGAADRVVSLEARLLDGAGGVVAGPFPAGTAIDGDVVAIATPDGFAVIQRRDEIVVTRLAPGGQLADVVVAASPYPVAPDGGGCSAGGPGAGLLAGLAALAALVARRRRR